MVPHRFPFRFVETTDRLPSAEEGLRISVTANAARGRGGPYPRLLAIEIMAQAALALLGSGAGGDGTGARGVEASGADGLFLAGVQSAELDAELEPGQDLLASARLVGSYGDLHKVSSTLERGERIVATADLLVGMRDR